MTNPTEQSPPSSPDQVSTPAAPNLVEPNNGQNSTTGNSTTSNSTTPPAATAVGGNFFHSITKKLGMYRDRFNAMDIKKKIIVVILFAVFCFGASFVVNYFLNPSLGPDYAQGNGRIEATRIDVATREGGRVTEIMVHEGDFVKPGQVLAIMKEDVLEAQRTEAEEHLAASANEVHVAESNLSAQKAHFETAEKRYKRTKGLAKDGAASQQQLEDDTNVFKTAQANLKSAEAKDRAAQATKRAYAASLARVEAQIADNILKSTTLARVQFRLTEPGEVLAAGGKVLNLIDLTDVYMTFFVPEELAGKIALGAEARILLDANPNMPIPARISFVASTAQFTPKTVETSSERQKLMFRVKARILNSFLMEHLDQIKTGVPGIAIVKLNPNVPWISRLAGRQDPKIESDASGSPKVVKGPK